jgi:SAM-dependent methyltransferase
MSEPWFVEAFKAGYLDVYPHRDLAGAKREAEFLVAHGVGGVVLDVCCGYGRHCQALRELGVRAFGVDLSNHLLERALELFPELRGRIACGDARALPFATSCADAAVSLFSSFGYFGEAGDRGLLLEVGRVLRAGGVLVLDLQNPERVRAELVPFSSSSRGDLAIEERRSLADGGRRVIKEVRHRASDGTIRSWREDVRLYAAAELEPWLAAAGIGLDSVRGDFDGSAVSARSPRQILVGRRR